MKVKYELHEGVAGNGSTIYLVVAVDSEGKWIHTHRFTNKAEAQHWMKWA